MCGRFSLVEAMYNLQQYYQFEMRDDFLYTPNENLAPSQQAAAVVQLNGTRYPASFRWGLIPPFAKDEKIGYKTFNARSETVAEKPSFRKAFGSKRCLIPASSFYEWKKSGKEKQPFEIKRLDGEPITFAGLWESWRNGDEIIRSCTILTTEPNDLMADIHNRMPVILEKDRFNQWLNPEENKDSLKQLLKPCANGLLKAEAISDDRFKRSGTS
ncbi:SOS response-associated peptidase [Jeotgalibacillus haloalkalitolerans]|uniref:Abasic site processing protein n=1 Tax=Jeotgalibacillus haloalkalitolerans TaxID=3104292 RepID=A0ABU5KQ94_9BACL|nr:SOS response-associated peptidase [Jeotgalibacillus sp. HH7-29]MDZ5713433.1 SOS response-associated peptidase [Jeotgalibacillus sp. HH7-29]